MLYVVRYQSDGDWHRTHPMPKGEAVKVAAQARKKPLITSVHIFPAGSRVS